MQAAKSTNFVSLLAVSSSLSLLQEIRSVPKSYYWCTWYARLLLQSFRAALCVKEWLPFPSNMTKVHLKKCSLRDRMGEQICRASIRRPTHSRSICLFSPSMYQQWLFNKQQPQALGTIVFFSPTVFSSAIKDDPFTCTGSVSMLLAQVVCSVYLEHIVYKK